MNRSNTLKTAGRVTAIALLATLAACASPRPETRVTRFHLQQPIAPGQIAVEPRTIGTEQSLEYQTYAGAVGSELSRLGFSVAPGLARSELVAVVEVDRGTREGGVQQSPVSVGLGGGFGGGGFGGGRFGRRGGGGIGLGGGVSFPVGKARQRYITMTELAVQLKRRSDGTVVWEGRAQQAARSGTESADPASAAAALAHALFGDFPGESGRTITVR